MTQAVLALALSPLAVAVVIWSVRQPMRVALPIFAALVPFGGALSIGSSAFGSLSSLAGLLLGGGLLLQLITTRRLARRIPADVPIWLLFLGVATVSALWTVDRAITTRGLVVLGSLVIVYVLTAVSDVDRTVLRRTENALLLGSVAVVCYGIVQLLFLGGFPSDTPGEGPVDDGRFGNDLLGPGVQAIALLLPFTIALSRAFLRTGAGQRLFHAALALLMLWGVLMTGSRTGVLAVAVGMVVLILAGPRRARLGLTVALAVGVVVAGLVWTFHPAGIAERTFESPTSSSGRTDIWQVGLAACTEHCDIGSGWGTFPQVYAATQATVPGARVLVGAEGSYQPHNLWLLAAVELGLLGLLLLAAGLGASVVEAMRLPQSLRAAPLSAVLGLVFAVFFLSSMEFKFFWMVLIMVAISRNLAVAEAAGEQVPPRADLPARSS